MTLWPISTPFDCDRSLNMIDKEHQTTPSQAVAWNDHNVYVLGAGFSKEAGLPIVGEFFNRTRDSVQWLKDNHHKREAEAVQRVLDFRLQAAAAALRVEMDVENIEQLFSLVAAQADSSDRLMKDVTLAIASTLEFASRVSQPRMARIQGPLGMAPPPNWPGKSNQTGGSLDLSLYDLITGTMIGLWDQKSLDTRNTILSFNYDLTIEEALRKHGISFNYGFSSSSVQRNDSGHDEKSPLLLLKLHGSINWGVHYEKILDPKTTPGSGEEHVIGMVDLGKLDLYSDFGALSQASQEPLLIPPTWRKVAFGALSKVWEKAVEALVTATRIIVVGYSMPVIDQHFKYLLAAGLQRNISLRDIIIANPALAPQHKDYKALRERTFEVFKPEMEKRGMINLWPYDASNCFFNPDFRENLNRHFPKGFERARGTFLLS
jgi:SIR2-like domain